MTASAAAVFLSVVVPCHNEAGALPLLLPRLAAACRAATESFEILLVDDGSTDGTWAAIMAARDAHPYLCGLRLARRYGQQTALSAGLAEAKGARVLLIDADLQDPPELLAAMMGLMDEGADVIYGQRRRRTGESFLKRTSAWLFYRFMRNAGDDALPVDAGDFRLINRRVVDILCAMPERQRYLRGMVAWIGLKQVALPYDRAARAGGTSKYPLRRMLHFAMDAITSFSAWPLRLAFWAGLGCGLLALSLAAYAIYVWLNGEAVAGWTSLACIMLFFFGLQFFCIGIIGEYVGRLYMESKHRPLFIIDRRTGA